MEIIIIFVLILLNGLFALAEIAVIAARPARLQERTINGDLGALKALQLKESPNRFLSTIQIGITLVGTLASTFGGASVAEQIAAILQEIPRLAPYAETLGLIVVVLVITYFSLVLGELAPKSLGLANPEKLAVALAPLMLQLSKLTSPLVSVLTFSTRLVLRVLDIEPAGELPVTDEEIRLMMAEGVAAGVFEPLETEMVEGVLRMSEQRSRTVMTPRHDIVWLDLEDPDAVNLTKLRESGYSRFPVCRGGLDDVLGMAYTKDILARYLAGKTLDLGEGLREPMYVPEALPALEMLQQFRDSQVHVALVLDEYGGVEGLITLRDVLEAIVGELPSAGKIEGPKAVLRADGESWLMDGNYPADNLEEVLGLRELPRRELVGYETVAGMLLALLDRIPGRGETVSWNDWIFEVVDMDGLRIDQVLVYKEALPEAE